VNAISPGNINAPIFEGWQQGDGLTKMKEELAKNVPLGRLGDPDEIVKAVAFFASDEASYIAGIDLTVHKKGSAQESDETQAGVGLMAGAISVNWAVCGIANLRNCWDGRGIGCTGMRSTKRRRR
jgi:hypothetical protein